MFNFLNDLFHSNNLQKAFQERKQILEIAKDVKFTNSSYIPKKTKKNFITRNIHSYELEWDKFISYKDRYLWSLPKSNYRVWKPNARKINQFVVHWDVCLNSISCLEILKKRGLSVHFLIDNDGTIIQTMDLDHKALHAGNNAVNKHSIGVEISNAWYLKYQNWYKNNGYGERPILTNVTVHGKVLEDFLGFYPVQIEALKALIKCLVSNKIIENNTLTSETVSQEVKSGQFKGIVSHYHISDKKIDCAGLDLRKVLPK